MPRTPVSDAYVSEREALRALALQSAASADELTATLKRIYDLVHDRDLAQYASAANRARAPEIMTEMFLMRVALRDRIPEWQAQGLMTRDVQHALRDALRVLRYASDMLGEVHAGFPAGSEDAPHRRAFREYSYSTFVHPKFDTGHNLEFRSGDVLLVRGTRHNSAAIARIGDVDSQFSHVCIVHVDEVGRGYVVEALIEDGAVIAPLKEALEHQLARAVLLRPRDPDLAARASKSIYDLVRASLAEGGTPILYDFSMRPEGRQRMYCSKLVAIAYEDASGGKLKLPAFGTRFNAANRSFYRRIGVKAAESFAPGDLEIDPAFDLVAEWHDDRFTSQVRLQDLIMSKMFEWMDAYGMRFREDWTVRLIAWLGRSSTKLSKTAQSFVASLFAKIPPHMPRRTIATVVMLHRTAQPLLEELQHLERLKTATEGRPLLPGEVFAHLEKTRRSGRGQLGYLVTPRSWRGKIAKLGRPAV